MSKPRLLSGVKPSGKLHIGNYLGAIRNFLELQEEYDSYFAVVDLHSLTEKFDPKTKRQEILNLFIDFLALGLDPEKSTLFIQSEVPEHLELAWIFSTLTPVGELERMTQYKDFVARGHSANAGLFTYPVLQAADILLYKPSAVPVGEDQLQHLELTNTIARRFNNTFGKTFDAVKPLLTKTPRVMSLLEPEKKMSKSLGENHVINLSDEPDMIAKKLARAVTDTGNEKSLGAGTNNLLSLLEIFGDTNEYEFYAEARKNGTIKYSNLKKNLAKLIAHYFADYRKRRAELASDTGYIAEMIALGQQKAEGFARATLEEVKQKVGLI
jgi:tryptophanyl-tRNA synthetase